MKPCIPSRNIFKIFLMQREIHTKNSLPTATVDPCHASTIHLTIAMVKAMSLPLLVQVTMIVTGLLALDAVMMTLCQQFVILRVCKNTLSIE